MRGLFNHNSYYMQGAPVGSKSEAEVSRKNSWFDLGGDDRQFWAEG